MNSPALCGGSSYKPCFSKLCAGFISNSAQADPSITPGSTLHYYEEVDATVGNVTDFYRYYRVPGLGHCWGGKGGQPEALFAQLQLWVENGTAPEASSVTITLPNNQTQHQVICPYPQRALRLSNATNTTLGSWTCQ